MAAGLLGGRYQLGEVLGQGGMAVVYAATDLRLGRRVAVKVLRDQYAADPEFVARLEREARAAAGLSHPHIVAVFDSGAEEGTPFIVMEYVPGEDLKALIRREAPLAADRIVSLGSQLCLALDYAHRQGVVHRDVKPHNVLVTPLGEVKVADFGIAVALGAPSLTQTGVVVGSAQYLSPEQARGESATPASDVYAAGVVLFELATGRVPFLAENPVAVARMHVERQPPPPSALNPRLPQTLDWLILRSLDKDPAARFRSAGEMAHALLDYERAATERTTRVPVVEPGHRGQGAVAAPLAPPRHLASRPRPREAHSAWPLVLVSGLALAGGLTFIGLAFTWLQGGGERTPGLVPPTAAPAATLTLTPRPAVLPSPTATATPEPTATATPSLPPSPTETATPVPAATSRPTETPRPTATLPPSPAPPSPTPSPVQLPLVRGMRVEDARTQLTRMGFRTDTREVPSAAPRGIVVDQSPPPGTLLAQGSSVILAVSKGE